MSDFLIPFIVHFYIAGVMFALGLGVAWVLHNNQLTDYKERVIVCVCAVLWPLVILFAWWIERGED